MQCPKALQASLAWDIEIMEDLSERTCVLREKLAAVVLAELFFPI